MPQSPMVASATVQTLSAMLRRSASRHADRYAIICGNTRWTYAELDAVADRFADRLENLGMGKGDRIAIFARNSHAFVAIRFAVARLGAILVPINFMLGVTEVSYILGHSGARMLFVDASTAKTGLEARTDNAELVVGLPAEHIEPPQHPDVIAWDMTIGSRSQVVRAEGAEQADVAQIIYTSGTESTPKGAVLTHGAVMWQYQSCIAGCEWSDDAIVVHAMPLFHCAQLDAILGPAIHVGAINIITADPAPANILPLLSNHSATSFFAPPTVWIELLASPLLKTLDLSNLTRGFYGASIMPIEVLREMRERLPQLRLWNLYGQTEIAPVASILRPEEHEQRLGSAGRPALHVQSRIVDDEMCDVPVGAIGEIVHRSPQLLAGYWRDTVRTAEAFLGGWFHSGDLGFMDEDGYIAIVDRKKDMIKTGGENVSSREVEEVLHAHPSVSEAAVIGLPDARWIELVTAVIVLRDGSVCDELEIITHCRRRLAGFKTPKRVIFLPSMPRNASGKVLKRDLRLAVNNATAAGTADESA